MFPFSLLLCLTEFAEPEILIVDNNASFVRIWWSTHKFVHATHRLLLISQFPQYTQLKQPIEILYYELCKNRFFELIVFRTNQKDD